MSDSPVYVEERDYTDGATAQDIQDAVLHTPRGRGEFQVATSYLSRRSSSSFRDYDDGGGAIFDGPGSVTIPSSVTGLRSARARSFNRSRRGSRAQESESSINEPDMLYPGLRRHASNRTNATEAIADSDIDTNSPVRARRMPLPRRSTDDTEDLPSPVDREERGRSTSMFGNLASFFGRRESPSRRSSASLSRRGSMNYAESPTEEEEEDRWGYHSSEDEASVEDAPSARSSVYPASSRGSHSRPASPATAFPGLGRDPIFGDTRIDMDEESIVESLPPSSGPPSQQDIHIADEDLRLRLIGFGTVSWRSWIWSVGTVCTLGLLGLLGHWFPEFWLYCVAKRRPFSNPATNLVIVEVCNLISMATYETHEPLTQNPSKDISICKISDAPYPYNYSSAFSSVFPTAASSATGTRPSSVIKLAPMAGATSQNGNNSDETLRTLRTFEFRYSKYILEPHFGHWTMIKWVSFR